MRLPLLLLLVVATHPSRAQETRPAQAQQAVRELMGVVVDAISGEPVPLANVAIEGTAQGTAADAEGHFLLALREGQRSIRVSAIGYGSESRRITDAMFVEGILIRLQPAVIEQQEVVVRSKGVRLSDPSASPHVQDNVEGLMDRIPGADFIQRGNFAWEPVIRGMSGGQIGLVIDGMKVVGACIDKMDPTSAYVDVENLERLDLTKGGFDLSNGAGIGGGVNLVTQKPGAGEPFSLSATAGVESASGLRRGSINGGGSMGAFSFRGSFSYRNASDFRPGGQRAIPESGFQKNNYKVDLSWQPHHAHTITASALGDNAWGVGYPVLLMDATLAQARIYSLTHRLTPHDGGALAEWETRLYHNTVDHWMDDFSREVRDRSVMRGMYMPMYGLTRTSGLISKAQLGLGKSRVGFTLDLTRTRSFGDMWMFSVFESIPDMHLLNLGDIVVRQGAIAVDWSRDLSSRLRFRANTRFDLSPRSVTSPQSRSILEGRWETDNLDRTYSAVSTSGTLEYGLSRSARLRLGVADVSRFPTHVENYGHYVYNYVDGYFYTGNPNLKPERSLQIEAGLDYWTARVGLKASLYANRISNYIIGEGDTGLESGSETYRFRVYRNASAARLMGGELSTTVGLPGGLSVAAAGSYTHGQNLDADEPLYLIPPLSGLISLRLDRARYWAEVESRMAMPQNRVARKVAQEDGTDGYFILNLRGNVTVREGMDATLGVENLFDTFYHDHLSFGNLPSEGRNLYLSLAIDM